MLFYRTSNRVTAREHATVAILVIFPILLPVELRFLFEGEGYKGEFSQKAGRQEGFFSVK